MSRILSVNFTCSQPSMKIKVRFAKREGKGVNMKKRVRTQWANKAWLAKLRCVLTCIVTSLSSTITSFVRKSAPIVALYWLLNFLFTYWFMSDVLPTPESPRMITFSNTFFLEVILQTQSLCWGTGMGASRGLLRRRRRKWRQGQKPKLRYQRSLRRSLGLQHQSGRRLGLYGQDRVL